MAHSGSGAGRSRIPSGSSPSESLTCSCITGRWKRDPICQHSLTREEEDFERRSREGLLIAFCVHVMPVYCRIHGLLGGAGGHSLWLHRTENYTPAFH